MAGGTALLGDAALTRKLDRLERRTSKRAITKGIRAGMTPIAKAMRAAINASEASPQLKRRARKTIGKRFAKVRKRNTREARVGFSVGKKQRKGGDDRGGRPGVGIRERNIHWFVLGTDERYLESTGQPTGRIRAVFGEVTDRALTGSQAASLAAARAKIYEEVLREARRKG